MQRPQPQVTSPLPLGEAFRAILAGLTADLGQRSPLSALVRTLRRSLGLSRSNRELMSNPAYRHHVSLVGNADPLPYLAYRHYLARGLSITQRARAAQHHYRHEVQAFDSNYLRAVYGGQGLLLWQASTPGGRFDIRLVPGDKVFHEGGLSVVANFNEQQICVLSYSTLPTTLLLRGSAMDDSTIFVTRKQLTTDHSYQAAFNKAFDRSTVAHFCFGALAGIALAQGRERLIAIDADLHPACDPHLRPHFVAAYSEFWRSLQGRAESRFGFTIDLPMRMTPLENMEAKARKRAEARRRHIDAVRDSAMSVMRSHCRAASVAAGAAPGTSRTPARAALFWVLMSIV